jgi:hypothetical protein
MSLPVPIDLLNGIYQNLTDSKRNLKCGRLAPVGKSISRRRRTAFRGRDGYALRDVALALSACRFMAAVWS